MRADAPISRATSVGRSLRGQRSAVTNGKRLHVVAPGDTKWARRFRDVLSEILSDLGEGLSEGQRQLARRAATLAIMCEQLEGDLARGDIIDAEKLEQYGKQCDRLGRCFCTPRPQASIEEHRDDARRSTT